ncbi:heavy-metal-associated domain-containing protein [Aquimarina mytili]|uniref:Cation transporter n=1 Tax=Aquimarina mytili TaxID=874423 RepID=A0A936ZV36_9FLAO|nr:heavy metal-associated domain-containing protein [Aquimarina mytili]MBL0682731.1 cation transporter [Aquimarina mytili]
MRHIYKITGMTCNGCRNSVEKTLSTVQGITSVSVDLEAEEAIIDMNTYISTEQLQIVLPNKYSISEKGNTIILGTSNYGKTSTNKEKTKLKELQPLFIILGYISIASVLLHYKNWDGNDIMLDFMGLFYIVFSFFKMLDLKGFPDSFKMYDPLAKAIPIYGWIYPFIETILGLMFLMRFQIPIALVVTLIVLGITTIGVTRTLLDKKSIQCACLGTALKLPMTEATFIENAIMIIMAIIMLTKIF